MSNGFGMAAWITNTVEPVVVSRGSIAVPVNRPRSDAERIAALIRPGAPQWVGKRDAIAVGELGRILVAPGVTVGPDEYRARFVGVDLDGFRARVDPAVFQTFVRFFGQVTGAEASNPVASAALDSEH